MVGFTFVKISIIITNFQCFYLGESFSLSKQLEAHPRQMQLGVSSFNSLQVKVRHELQQYCFCN